MTSHRRIVYIYVSLLDYRRLYVYSFCVLYSTTPIMSMHNAVSTILDEKMDGDDVLHTTSP